MIQVAINARGTVEFEFFILDGIPLKLVRLQFDLNSTMPLSTHTYAFSGKVSRRNWGSTRSGRCLRRNSIWMAYAHMYSWCDSLGTFTQRAPTWMSLYIYICILYLHGCWWMSWQQGVWKYTGLCQAIVLEVSGKEWIQSWIHVEYAAYGEQICFGQVSSTDEVWYVISIFSGSLHVARSLHWIWMTVEYTLVENNVFWKLVFGELRKFCGDEDWREEMCNVAFVFPCACSTTNSKPFQPGFISTTLWRRCLSMFMDVLQNCMWATGYIRDAYMHNVYI